MVEEKRTEPEFGNECQPHLDPAPKAQELSQQLAEVVDIEFRDHHVGFGLSIGFKSKSGEKFMEDNVIVCQVNSFTIPDVEPWNETIIEVTENINETAIYVELWGKESTGLKDSDFIAVRKIVDAFAEKYNLVKIYSYGYDDGGYVLFNKEGRAVMTTYFGRHGTVEINEFGPATEDEYWQSKGSFLSWDSPNLKSYPKMWRLE